MRGCNLEINTQDTHDCRFRFGVVCDADPGAELPSEPCESGVRSSLRLRRDRQGDAGSGAGLSGTVDTAIHRNQLRRPQHVVDDDQQPPDRPGHRQARDVHRRQHPRQRGPGRRGWPLHNLVSRQKPRKGRIPHEADRRIELLYPADGQSRRSVALVQETEHVQQFPVRHEADGQRQRRSLR